MGGYVLVNIVQFMEWIIECIQLLTVFMLEISCWTMLYGLVDQFYIIIIWLIVIISGHYLRMISIIWYLKTLKISKSKIICISLVVLICSLHILKKKKKEKKNHEQKEQWSIFSSVICYLCFWGVKVHTLHKICWKEM